MSHHPPERDDRSDPSDWLERGIPPFDDDNDLSDPADESAVMGFSLDSPTGAGSVPSPSPTAGSETEGGGASNDEDAATEKRRGGSRSFWRELPILILVALVVAILIKTFLIQAFFIPSASMRETLVEGDRVMVNKLAYRFGDPSRGDVIVFDSPLEPDHDGENLLSALVRHVAESLGLSSPDSALIKRVIAVGGETLEIAGGRVLVDGVAIHEPYLSDGVRMPDFGPETVPEGHVFVMGDNRQASQDSRRFGAVSEDEIIGRAFVRVWPPSRWGGL